MNNTELKKIIKTELFQSERDPIDTIEAIVKYLNTDTTEGNIEQKIELIKTLGEPTLDPNNSYYDEELHVIYSEKMKSLDLLRFFNILFELKQAVNKIISMVSEKEDGLGSLGYLELGIVFYLVFRLSGKEWSDFDEAIRLRVIKLAQFDKDLEEELMASIGNDNISLRDLQKAYGDGVLDKQEMTRFFIRFIKLIHRGDIAASDAYYNGLVQLVNELKLADVIKYRAKLLKESTGEINWQTIDTNYTRSITGFGKLMTDAISNSEFASEPFVSHIIDQIKKIPGIHRQNENGLRLGWVLVDNGNEVVANDPAITHAGYPSIGEAEEGLENSLERNTIIVTVEAPGQYPLPSYKSYDKGTSNISNIFESPFRNQLIITYRVENDEIVELVICEYGPSNTTGSILSGWNEAEFSDEDYGDAPLDDEYIDGERYLRDEYEEVVNEIKRIFGSSFDWKKREEILLAITSRFRYSDVVRLKFHTASLTEDGWKF